MDKGDGLGGVKNEQRGKGEETGKGEEGEWEKGEKG